MTTRKSSTRGRRRIRTRPDEPDLSHLTIEELDKIINPQGRTSTKTGMPTRQTRQQPQQPEQQPEDHEELDNEQVNSRAKKTLPPVDTSQIYFTISCSTKFGDKEFCNDLKTVKLGEFKLHEYIAKATKGVHKYAEKHKVGFEQEGAVATVKGSRLPKQYHVRISQPSKRGRTRWLGCRS